MPDRKRLAIESLKSHIEYTKNGNRMNKYPVYIEVEEAENILALLKETEGMQELVRCKDCKFMYEDDVFQCGIKAGYFPVHEDWFCADGERKDGEVNG